MKKNYSFPFILALFIIQLVKAQLPPLMNPIQGPNVVCSSPASPKSYTASASGGASSYTWTTYGTPGVSFSNPNSSVTSVSFPYPYLNPTFTLYCSASNGAGTSNIVSMVVSVKETPHVTFSGNNVFCQGSSTQLSASPTILSSSSTLAYNWSPATGLNSTINSAVICNASSSTNYSVLLTLGSCTNMAFVSVIVNTCVVGISENNSNNNLNVQCFPNPNNGSFTIKSDIDQKIQIFNEMGQHVQSLELRSGEDSQISGLKPGLYFIVNTNSRKKIVVTN